MALSRKWKNNNIDILLVYKIISIGINEILVHKGVPLFHFILKLGMIKIMSGLIENPFLKKNPTQIQKQHLILL